MDRRAWVERLRLGLWDHLTMATKIYLDGVLIDDPRSLEEARQEALDRAEICFGQALDAGMPWAGKVLQVDEASRQNLTSAALGAQLGFLPPGFAWRMADNTFLPLTAPERIAMAAAGMAHYLALSGRRWAMRDAARAAATREEADEIAF